MANYIEGNLKADGKKFGIVVARFNSFISEKLLEGALDSLARSGAKDSDIDVARVPGAFEIPLIAKKMVSSGKYDALICLGVVIRGSTPHFGHRHRRSASVGLFLERLKPKSSASWFPRRPPPGS